MSRPAVFLLALLGFGCPHNQPDRATTPDGIVREMEAPDEIRDLRTGETVEEEAMIRELMRARVIYLGENHDQARDHAMQYRILRQLHRLDPTLGIGMEMFQRNFQGALDLWRQGQLDEVALRQRTEWDQRWGFDFRHYRPVLEMVRAHGLVLVGLNAPRELTRAIARGGFESLSDELRDQLPPELRLDDAEHRAMFDAAMAEHPHAGDPGALDRLYGAQVVWDETMAERVHHGLEQGAGRLVVLAGQMHVRGGLGIPKRAATYGAEPYKIVLAVDGDDDDAIEAIEDADPPAADYLWIW